MYTTAYRDIGVIFETPESLFDYYLCSAAFCYRTKKIRLYGMYHVLEIAIRKQDWLIFSDGEKASKQNLFKYLNHILDQKRFVELLMPLRKSSQQNVKYSNL
jgi:hypothetical protein